MLRHSTADYFLSRVLRIVPALFLVTCVEVLVIGPIFTKLSLAEYFSSGVTLGRFWNPAVFPITFTLPGVFTSLPIPRVNGSLWTLPVLLFAGVGAPASVLLYMLCLPYLVIYVATKTPVVSIRKIGDLSYGLFLFAFPIQQSLQETFSHIGPRTLTITATAIGLAVAYASYWTVESRFLKLRKKRRAELHAVATGERTPKIAAVR